METIEILRNQYYEAIQLLQDEEDIKNALPQPEFTSFFQIMYGLIEKLSLVEKELIKELNKIDNQDKEMLEYLKEELELNNFKKSLCERLIKEARKEEQDEEIAEKGSPKNLIFATTGSGKIYLEEDLKDIPEEYYIDIIECLESLKNGFTENNEIKGKSLKNNARLKGLHEIKQFKIRIGYINLDPNLTFVILAKTKKSDNSSQDRGDLINRNSKVGAEFQKLKELIKDENKKTELIEKNQEIENNLIEYLNKNKRGRKWKKKLILKEN